jgi:porphobilinogen synthase
MMSFDRQRRLRIHPSLRTALAEIEVRPSQLVKPLFIHGGTQDIPLPQLPDSAILSLSKGLLPAIERLMDLGVLGVNLYPSLERELKNAQATEALNPSGLIPHAISMIKQHFPA